MLHRSRHNINILMDKVDVASHDINTLYNLTTSLATSISFHQLIHHIRSVFANLCNSLNGLRTVSTHTMGLYRCSHNRNLFTFYLLWIYKRCCYRYQTPYPPTLHLPVSPDDTLHFFRYLCYTHSDDQQTIFTTD